MGKDSNVYFCSQPEELYICVLSSARPGNPQPGTVEMGLLHFQVRLGCRRSQAKIISILNKMPSPALSPPDDKCICPHELDGECLKKTSLVCKMLSDCKSLTAEKRDLPKALAAVVICCSTRLSETKSFGRFF